MNQEIALVSDFSNSKQAVLRLDPQTQNIIGIQQGLVSNKPIP